MSYGMFRQVRMAALLALAAGTAVAAGPQSDEGRGAINVRKALDAKAMTDPGWPGEWQVFGPIPPGQAKLPPEKLKALPKQIDIGGKTCAPRAMKAQDNTLDLRPLWPSARGGKDKERLGAYCFAEIDCPADGTLYVNVGADWWAQWTVDGRVVHDTLQIGNAPLSPTYIEKRGFSAAVTKGRHVVAVLVQSGSGGWGLSSLGGFTTRPAGQIKPFFEPWKTVYLEQRNPSRMTRVDKLRVVPPLTNTEVDRIIQEVEAPARFAKHVPRFRVVERAFLSEISMSEQRFVESTAYDVYDGDVRIGSFNQHHGYVNPRFDEMSPSYRWNPPPKPGIPPGGHRYTRLLNATLFPVSQPARIERKWYLAPDGKTLTLAYEAIPTPECREPWDVHRTVGTWRLDPFCGYVYDAVVEFAAPKVPSYLWVARDKQTGKPLSPPQPIERDGGEYVNVLPSHVIEFTTPMFPWRYERTVYCPLGTDKYVGWITDTWQASDSDSKGLYKRKDGFIGFFCDPEGWSQVFSHNSPDDVAFTQATCWKLQDQHCQFSAPRPKGDGPCRVRVFYRYMNIPPEATRYVLDRVEMMPFRTPFICVRQGEVQYFENDERLPTFAAPWSEGVTVAQGPARSGKSSAIVRPRTDRSGKPVKTDVKYRIDVLRVLESSKTYRLEAWAKVEGGAKAWLRVDPPLFKPRKSRTSSYDGPEFKPIDSAVAETKDGWQKLEVTFTTPPEHGRTPFLFFRASLPGEGAVVYLDDVALDIEKG